MHIYNVTYHVEKLTKDEWLNWLKENHIPEVLKTKKVEKAILLKVDIEDSEESEIFAVQYYNTTFFSQEEKEFLNPNISIKFGEKVLSFGSKLEQVESLL